ncbi:Eco57I restriction-modification methylase domain-containing protein [Megasphaera paucivorans]|uniref:Eco57I restriction-modification methylase domain-containing protein n=1 Tax=Megasphaera paucivorans TaxID=349095 RepID=UPI003D04B457
MKFDFAIGNPPYQDESNGDMRNYAPPVYNLFLDEAYKVANTVEMIHPARFLFNAGSTPRNWNEKMLQDPHLNVPYYESDSNKIFPGLSTPIKGGIAITYRDNHKNFGAIKTFSQFPELNTILHKVIDDNSFQSISDIVYSRTSYRLTDTMHHDYPNAIKKLSNGHAYDMSSNIFQRLPEIFLANLPNDEKKYIGVMGRENNQRTLKYIRKDYVNDVDNLFNYKVLIAQATGRGIFGETISVPIIAEPGIASTETFISIGKFDKKKYSKALVEYIKTKFLRALLGVLKVTQNGNKPVWKCVPIQDFTNTSDIDWSKPIPEIDQQLYKKYGLSDDEIHFIEANVKEMA